MFEDKGGFDIRADNSQTAEDAVTMTTCHMDQCVTTVDHVYAQNHTTFLNQPTRVRRKQRASRASNVTTANNLCQHPHRSQQRLKRFDLTTNTTVPHKRSHSTTLYAEPALTLYVSQVVNYQSNVLSKSTPCTNKGSQVKSCIIGVLIPFLCPKYGRNFGKK